MGYRVLKIFRSRKREVYKWRYREIYIIDRKKVYVWLKRYIK